MELPAFSFAKTHNELRQEHNGAEVTLLSRGLLNAAYTVTFVSSYFSIYVPKILSLLN